MFNVSPLSPSPLDSARFGLKVCRASYENTDEATVLRELIDNMADVAIYRMPSSNSSCIDKLQRSGFEVIHAGTLVYYTLDLPSYEPKPLRNSDVEITLAEAADDAELETLAHAAFSGYVSHYSANPLFDPEKVLAGYCEWTLRHRVEPERARTWVARRAGRIIAYANCEFDAKDRICEAGLFGVAPEESGSGLFGDLIRFTQRYFRDLGFAEMRMSTKVGNFAVQKVWAREGYHLYEAYDTFHVNALLSLDNASSQRRTVRFSRERLENFQAAGSVQAKTGGSLLLDPELSKLLRERHPRGETTTIKVSQLLLQPLRHDLEYSLSVRFPVAPADGNELAIASVWDEFGTLCMLSYYWLRTPKSSASSSSR